MNRWFNHKVLLLYVKLNIISVLPFPTVSIVLLCCNHTQLFLSLIF